MRDMSNTVIKRRKKKNTEKQDLSNTQETVTETIIVRSLSKVSS